jgi:hypothetical protein
MNQDRYIQQADPIARRRALLWFAAIALAGSAALVMTQRWLSEVVNLPDARAARASFVSALWWVSVVASACTVGAGVYAWRFAARVRAAFRFPPPGQPVVRDTVILEGQAAVRRANALRTLGALLVIAGIGLLLAAAHLVSRLGGGAA